MSIPAPALELVTIGDELVLGETLDTNGAWLGRRLASEGFRVARHVTVGDDVWAIRDAVEGALVRTGTVLCTGGLGPTEDDLTRPAVAGLFGRDLHVDHAVLEMIRERFARLDRPMPERNRTQAEVPDGARILPNRHGTAPGLVLEDGDRMAILLPGVPSEMRALMEEQVLPLLRARWRVRLRPILHRTLRTTGVPESRLAEQLEGLEDEIAPLTLAYLPASAGVDLRLTSWGAMDESDAERALDAAETLVRARTGDAIYARNGEDLAEVVGRELANRNLTVSLAESCTGGLIAKRLTDVPGSSAYLLSAIVAYANSVKEALLGVRRQTLEAHGAVSRETAREMALGAIDAASADLGLSVTGIAGPGGGTPEKPVGTVWIAVASRDGHTEERMFRLSGDRQGIRDRAAQAALAMLLQFIARGGQR